MAKKFVGQEYMAATNGKGLHQQSKGNRLLSRLTMTGSVFITIVSVLIVAFCVAFQLCPVKGKSMMKTLNATGENTDKALTCTIGEPNRGDIIVMKMYAHDLLTSYDYHLASKGDQDALNRLHLTQQAAINALKAGGYTDSDSNGYYKLIVKRLIGKPGDRISMHQINGKYYVYLNGKMLDEDYLDSEVAHHNALNFVQLWNLLNNTSNADLKNWVTTDYQQLLSTNTDNATDNRGTPSAKMLTIPDGYYFLMGDNRGGVSQYNYSLDSCYFGPLPISSYHSCCVDVMPNETSMPQYLWDKFVYYVCFGWAWQK